MVLEQGSQKGKEPNLLCKGFHHWLVHVAESEQRRSAL